VGVVAAAASQGGARTMAPLQLRRVIPLPEDQSLEKPFPWIWIFTGAGLVGGALALAYNYGLLGRKR